MSNWPLGASDYQAWCPFKGAFSRSEADKVLALWDDGQSQKGVVGKGMLNVEVRNSDIRWINPTPETEWIFDRVSSIIERANSEFFGLNLTELPALQLTQYNGSVTGHYGQHVDAAYGRDQSSSYRKLSVSINLSRPSEYKGGELLIYPMTTRPVECNKIFCGGTVFRSHIIHEVTPVTKGRRMSLVAWACGPKLR